MCVCRRKMLQYDSVPTKVTGPIKIVSPWLDAKLASITLLLLYWALSVSTCSVRETCSCLIQQAKSPPQYMIVYSRVTKDRHATSVNLHSTEGNACHGLDGKREKNASIYLKPLWATPNRVKEEENCCWQVPIILGLNHQTQNKHLIGWQIITGN